MSEDFAAPEAGYGPGGRDRRGQYRADRTTDHSSPDRTQPLGRNPETTAELGLDDASRYARDGRETTRSQDIDRRMDELRRRNESNQRGPGDPQHSDRLVADQQRTEQPGRDTNDVTHPANPQRQAMMGQVADEERTANTQTRRLGAEMAEGATADPEKSNAQVAKDRLNEMRGHNSNGIGSDTRQQKLVAEAASRGDLQQKIDAAQQRGRQTQGEGREGGQQTRQREQAQNRRHEDRDRGERTNTHSHAAR